MTDIEKLKRIAHVIKCRFTNLTVEQVIDLAGDILTELEKPS